MRELLLVWKLPYASLRNWRGANLMLNCVSIGEPLSRRVATSSSIEPKQELVVSVTGLWAAFPFSFSWDARSGLPWSSCTRPTVVARSGPAGIVFLVRLFVTVSRSPFSQF